MDKNNFNKINKFKFTVFLQIETNENLNYSIESILNQTLSFEKNIQMIILNQSNDEKTDEIILEHYNKYPLNILFFSDNTAPLYDLYKSTSKFIEGKYCVFVNSNDYIDKSTLTNVYNFYNTNENSVNIVSIPYVYFGKFNKDHELNNKFKDNTILNLKDCPNNPLFSLNSTIIESEIFKKYIDSKDINNDFILLNSILSIDERYGIVSTANYYKRKSYDDKETIDTNHLIKELKNIREFISKDNNKSFAFLKYSLIYYITELIRNEELNSLNKNERNTITNELQKILQNAEDNYITKNANVNFRYKSFIMYLKNSSMHLELSDSENKLYLKTGTFQIDELSNHRIWLDIVEIKGNILNISGLFNTHYNSEFIKIHAIIENQEEKSIKNCEQIFYPQNERKNVSYLSIPWMYRYNFNVDIPIENLHKTRISFKILFSNKEIKYSFKPLIEFRLTSYLSEIGIYYVKKPYILLHDSKSISIIEYSIFKMFKLELRNILRIFNSNEKHKINACLMRLFYLMIYIFMDNKEIWLINDRIDNADDNAKHLFKYACSQKDNIDKYFIIDKDSVDYPELKNISPNIIKYGSFKHKILYLFSSKRISSFLNEAFFNPYYNQKEYDDRKLYNNLVVSPRYFLQHGVISCDLTKHVKRFNHNLRLIVTSADSERQSFYDLDYNYPSDVVQALGLPRYDNLKLLDKKKIILFIPSWRSYLDKNEESLINSDYFKSIVSLMKNKDFKELLNKTGYKFIFKPHPELVKYVRLFENKSVIIDVDSSFQDLFGKSSILISDFSSVVFDFAYLKKPVIYYQPNDDYHYEKGYFDYETMGFGKVITTENELIELIKKYIKNNCKMESKYQNRVDSFFKYHDQNNSKRVYEWIKNN